MPSTRSRRQVSKPSIPGKTTSSTIASYPVERAMSSASSPVPAMSTVSPSSVRPRRISAAIFTSSSTTKTCMGKTIDAEDEEKMRSLWGPGGSASPVGDNEVSGHSDEETEGHQPEPQLAMPVTAHPVSNLADDIEDRTS